MRGVQPYHNKFRAYVVDSEGKHHQQYFDNEKLAEEFILKHRPTEIGNANYKKRSNVSSASSDLPVGLFETVRRKTMTHGVLETTTIVATVVVGGKPKTKHAAFGRNRTREEAIEICMGWRVKQLEQINE